MKVLIVLALIGVAYAGEAILAQAPLGYSSLIVDEPKPSYEYSSSVQTPTYNNYAHVRSGGNLERRIYNFATPFAAPLATPIVAAAEPLLAETKYLQPATYAAPVLKAAPLSTEFRPAEIAAPGFAIPTTKLLPISYEPKPLYRFAAPAPAIVAAAPAAAQILAVENKFIGEGKSQYHSQNELGEATYGHREAFQSHDAVQDAQGNKAGSFSYVSPDGRLLTTEYIADAAGYRVASNALPNAPNAAAPPAITPAITPAIAAVEKPVETGDAIVVEAKSRSRRSAVFAPTIRAAAPIYYSSPLAYSSYSYAPAITKYAYTTPYYSPLYRSYAYTSAYSYPSYYSYAFRK